jgi:hypothetical protein
MGEKMAKDWRRIEYFVPIKEFSQKENDFLVRGAAINECVTRNGVMYTKEELTSSARSLCDKPILKDHTNSVDSIVGRTTQNGFYDAVNNCVAFEGRIIDKKMQEMINDGRITNVSVGAMVRDLCKEEIDGESYLVAKGIDFVELSLVAVPADPNAGFAKAIMESFELKEKETKDSSIIKVTTPIENKIEERGNTMGEEDKIKTQLEEKARVLEEQKIMLEKKLQEYADKEMSALRTEYADLAKAKNVSVKEGFEKLSKEVLEALVETLKSIKTMEIKEVKETATKGDVPAPQSSVENKNAYRVEKSTFGKGVALYSENVANISSQYTWRS